MGSDDDRVLGGRLLLFGVAFFVYYTVWIVVTVSETDFVWAADCRPVLLRSVWAVLCRHSAGRVGGMHSCGGTWGTNGSM